MVLPDGQVVFSESDVLGWPGGQMPDDAAFNPYDDAVAKRAARDG